MTATAAETHSDCDLLLATLRAAGERGAPVRTAHAAIARRQARAGASIATISEIYRDLLDLERRGCARMFLDEIRFADGERAIGIWAAAVPAPPGGARGGPRPVAAASPTMPSERARLRLTGRAGERGDTLVTTLIAIVIAAAGIATSLGVGMFLPNADAYRPAKIAVDEAFHAVRDVARTQDPSAPSGASMYVYPQGTGFEIDVLAGRPAPGEVVGAVVRRFVVPNASLTLADGTQQFGEFVGVSGTLTQPQSWDGQSAAAAPAACDRTHAITVVLTAPRVSPQTLSYGCAPQ